MEKRPSAKVRIRGVNAYPSCHGGPIRYAGRMTSERLPLFSAGVLGAAGILLGALGEHGTALNSNLIQHGTSEAWQIAVRYQLIHAVALLGLAGWLKPPPHGTAARRTVWAARLWVVGTLVFSGSLYVLAVTGIRALGWLTPVGGLSLVAGWVCLAGAAVAPRSEFDL